MRIGIRCPVKIDLQDFFDTLGPSAKASFQLHLPSLEKRSPVISKYFTSRKSAGFEYFVSTSGTIEFKGELQRTGTVFMTGRLNNCPKKICRIEFSLRTGRGFITALF